jgi:uncharacterized BrkB/YihY/UPF0761 family membrane protein
MRRGTEHFDGREPRLSERRGKVRAAASKTAAKAGAQTERLRKSRYTGRSMAAYERYYATEMRDAASAVVYYATLSLFPVLVLAYLGLAWLAQRRPNILKNADQNLAGTLGIPVNAVSSLFNAQAHALLTATTSIIGVIGVVYGAWAWMDTLGRALRTVWGTENESVVWRRYRRDSLAALVSIPTMFAAFALSGVGVTRLVRRFDKYGLKAGLVVDSVICLLVILIATAVFAVVCQQLYRRLGGAEAGPQLWRAATVSGLCLAVLSAGAQVLLRQTVSNPYGIVINILGLMVWISVAVRVVLSLALWAAAGPTYGRQIPHSVIS